MGIFFKKQKKNKDGFLNKICSDTASWVSLPRGTPASLSLRRPTRPHPRGQAPCPSLSLKSDKTMFLQLGSEVKPLPVEGKFTWAKVRRVLSAASGSNPEPEAGEPVWKARGPFPGRAPRGRRTRLRGQRCRGAARRGGAAGAASPLHGSRRASQNASACHSGTSGVRPPSHRPRPTRRGCPCVLGASGSGRRASPPV